MIGKQALRDLYRVLRKQPALAAPMAVADQLLRGQGFLRQSGWLESYRSGVPVAGGKPLPWFTYAAIAFLDKRVDPELRVFEYGAGYSTLWWASRVKAVVACEGDPDWVQRLREMVPSNVTLFHQAVDRDGDYCRAAARYQSDVIVIDGRDRVNCAKACLEGLSEGGVIVWDNSDRSRYADGFDFLAARGFRRLDFAGPGPVNFTPWMTSLFYRDHNRLGI
jgi:hypothetical protein